VQIPQANSKRERRVGNGSRGHSLIEVLIVLVIILVVAGISLIRLNPQMQQYHANASMDAVKGALRQARELAISNRRTIQVQFAQNPAHETPGEYIILTQINVPVGQTVLLTLPIDNSVLFQTFPTMPDTPDGFGDGSGIFFGGVTGGPPVMNFQSDGEFTDGNGNFINGTVFLGVTGQPSTARAVTVLGTTGRVRSYMASGNFWVIQ
jgi:prepilin-type N-terminal cleavage/methylation domain-containing protein